MWGKSKFLIFANPERSRLRSCCERAAAGFTDDPLRAAIVEEHVVHQRGQPRADILTAAKGVLAHDHVPSPVIVVGVVERRDAIFLGPIELEITERCITEAAHQRQHMRIGQDARQISSMLVEITRLVPERIDRGSFIQRCNK